MSTPPRPTLPPAVLEALKRGNKIEALKLLRDSTKGGLGEAKAMVEALQGAKAAVGRVGTPSTSAHVSHNPVLVHGYRRRPGLSPGEVPASGGSAWWVLLLLAGGVLAYFLA